jgi:voltage-gated potassium channel
MSRQQEQEKPSKAHRSLLIEILADRKTRPVAAWAVAMIVIGTILFRWLEGWSWVDSFYFSVVSLTTVGYGDFVPTEPITKILSVVYIVSGIGMLFSLIDVIADKRLARRIQS